MLSNCNKAVSVSMSMKEILLRRIASLFILIQHFEYEEWIPVGLHTKPSSVPNSVQRLLRLIPFRSPAYKHKL